MHVGWLGSIPHRFDIIVDKRMVHIFKEGSLSDYIKPGTRSASVM